MEHGRLWRLTHQEVVIFLALLVALCALMGFLQLSDRLGNPRALAFDEWLLLSTRQADDPSRLAGPDGAVEYVRHVSAMGSIVILGLLVLAVMGYLALAGHRLLMGMVLLTCGGGLALMQGIKSLIDRPRPEIVPHLDHVSTSSFPSGHSMGATVVYLTLAVLVAVTLRRPRLKAYVVSIAVLLALLVGASRVVLGVHHPTDVIGGWIMGLAWASACWGLTAWLCRRRLLREPLAIRDDAASADGEGRAS